MVGRNRVIDVAAHAILILGVLLTLFPVYIAFVASTHPPENLMGGRFPLLPGDQLTANYGRVLLEPRTSAGRISAINMMGNSFIMAVGITVGKIFVSFLAAFAIVYFRFRGRMFFFFLILITLMLPVEVRIVPTYDVVANVFSPLNTLLRAIRLDALLGIEFNLRLSLLNTHAGLILPLIASATATFLFRQFFQTVPDELVDAAQLDGASPMQFMTFILLPLSRTNLAALCVILFVYGWNQYLWPLLVTTQQRYQTIVMGIQRMVNAAESQPLWGETMALALLALLPPVIVVVALQRLFLKGLVDTEK